MDVQWQRTLVQLADVPALPEGALHGRSAALRLGPWLPLSRLQHREGMMPMFVRRLKPLTWEQCTHHSVHKVKSGLMLADALPV